MSDISLGLMSGTSCDGISAALAEFKNQSVRVITERTTAYPHRLARTLIRGPKLSAEELSSLNVQLGDFLPKPRCGC